MTRDKIIEQAKKQFDEKTYKSGKCGDIVDYTNLRLELPAYKNILGQLVVRVSATYHNGYSSLNDKRVTITVIIRK